MLPVWRLLLLSVLTAGVYQVYWLYRNWCYLREYHGLAISPAWKTSLFFMPILGLQSVCDQLEHLHAMISEKGKPTFSPGAMFLLWLLFWAFYWVPGVCNALSFLTVLPLAYVQVHLNRHWQRVQVGSVLQPRVSAIEVALLVVWGLFLALIVMSAVVPE